MCDSITQTLRHLTFLNVVTLTVSPYLLECGDSITQTLRHLTFLNVVTPSRKHCVILPSWMWWLHHANTASSYLLECGHANSVILPFRMGWPHHANTVSSYLLECGHANSVTLPSRKWWPHHANGVTLPLPTRCGSRHHHFLFPPLALQGCFLSYFPAVSYRPPPPTPAKNPELPRAVSRMCRSLACSCFLGMTTVVDWA